MEMTFSLAYGDQSLPVTVRAREIEVVEAVTPAPIADLPAAFRRAVEDDAIGSQPLREVISAQDEVTIVISDLTRAWMHQEKICPLLMDYLHDVVGMPYAQMVFLVALGTHRPQTEEELEKLVSPRVYANTRVCNHDCHGELIQLGTTSRGTVVEVNPLVVGRKVILVGGTVHHLLAGYGGGRKSILPGVCGEKTIQSNHRHALDPVLPRSSELVGCRKVEGNPVHEDMAEAARMVAPVFGINLVVDGQGRHLALPSGDVALAWAESCRLVDRFNGVPIARKADAVVVSAGGFPKDINLYQSSKTMINAYQAVKEGGQLYFLSECREGGGPEAFFGWSRFLPDDLDSALRANFTIAGYIFYVCCEIAAHTELHMLSRLPDHVLRDMRIHGHADPASLRTLDFGDRHVIVMPHGGSTFPMAAES